MLPAPLIIGARGKFHGQETKIVSRRERIGSHSADVSREPAGTAIGASAEQSRR
jgi:hypothetical protein